jgi:hypothetical protein
MNDTQKPASSTTGRASKGFTDEERAAMKERAQELKAAVRRSPRADKADGESDVLAKIAEMPEPDRVMAERLRPTNLVQDARLCQGRQRRLLLPKRAEVQDQVRDAHRRELARPEARRASRGERSRSKEYVGNPF